MRQSTLQVPVHATVHDAPFEHTTLLLGPTLTSQLASRQSTFELSAVLTVHMLPAGQSTLHEPSHA